MLRQLKSKLKFKMEGTGFKIINILLLESNFNRVLNVTFNEKAIENAVDISVKSTVNENKVIVKEILNFESKFNGISEVSCKIAMIGIFEKIGETNISIEDFGNVNGPAILFPYIREHFSNLALKAGLGNIFLPPTNFVSLNNKS